MRSTMLLTVFLLSRLTLSTHSFLIQSASLGSATEAMGGKLRIGASTTLCGCFQQARLITTKRITMATIMPSARSLLLLLSKATNQDAAAENLFAVDPLDAALSAMSRSISSAHLDNFRSNGSIVLRRVVLLPPVVTASTTTTTTTTTSNDKNDTRCAVVAAGVACRLLACPAVSRVEMAVIAAAAAAETTTTTTTPQKPQGTAPTRIHVCIATETDAEENSGINERLDGVTSGGGYLGLGDAWARIVEDTVALRPSSSTGFFFEACGSDDPNAFFVDPFFNTRGDTPTTVIQWSKGTIF